MKINKVVVLSAVLLSSIAGAMEEEGEKFNPNRLGTLYSKKIGANHVRATVPNMQFTDHFCRSRVVEICENPELPLDEKIKSIGFWEKQNGLTEEGKKQIKAVESSLKQIYNNSKKKDWNWTLDDLNFLNSRSINLKLLFERATANGKFKPDVAQFAVNLAGLQIAQSSKSMRLAINCSKEPSKSVQYLLESGFNPNQKIKMVTDRNGSTEEMTALEVAKLKSRMSQRYRKFSSNVYATQEEYDKTIEILEKAEQEEIYSDIPKLFQ